MQLLRMTLLAVIVSLIASAASQAANDPLSGKYEGVAKSASLGDLPLKVELKNDNGKITGMIETPQGPAPITGGTFADGKLNMKFDAGGNEGTVTAELKDEKVVGTWELGGQTGTVELKRVVMSDAVPAGAPAAGAAPDPLSGDWDGTVDAQGQTIPFTMKLKLEGATVTGTAESAQGTTEISKGSWVGEKLSFTLETPNGSIVMTAVVKEGKLAGDFDLAGQFQGKWEAKRK